MYFTLITFVVIAILIVLGQIAYKMESFAYSSIYDHPTKCFDCEKDAIRRWGPEYGWLGQKTKSFDAEKEMIAMTGDVASAIDTHPIRYY